MLNELNLGFNVLNIIHILHIGELSNFFNYIVYDLIKKKKSIKFITITKIIQLIWFSYFRLYYNSYLVIKYFPLFKNRFLASLLISLHILGLIWCWKQFKITIKDIKNIYLK